MSTAFWFCVFGVLYSYFLYPLILLALPKRERGRVKCDATPLVTIIVAVHNEEGRVAAKIENTLSLRYPRDRLEIVVASDGSDDQTEAIVRAFGRDGVVLVRNREREGKEAAQKLAIAVAKGEVLVFTDVAAMLPENAIETLVERYADGRVGAISSEDRFITADGRLVGEGAYVRYEMWLRRLESRVNGLVGLSGSFFSARKKVCDSWDIRVPSDFNVALNCFRKGYVAVSDPDVVAYYRDVKDERKEYQRKWRTIIRGMSGVFHNTDILNPFRFGFVSFQLWSHKIMRWLVPWFMLGLLASSVVLMNDSAFYSAILGIQAVFYSGVLAAAVSRTVRRETLLRIPYYFAQANIAAAHAGIAFLMGRRVTSWQPTNR